MLNSRTDRCRWVSFIASRGQVVFTLQSFPHNVWISTSKIWQCWKEVFQPTQSSFKWREVHLPPSLYCWNGFTTTVFKVLSKHLLVKQYSSPPWEWLLYMYIHTQSTMLNGTTAHIYTHRHVNSMRIYVKTEHKIYWVCFWIPLNHISYQELHVYIKLYYGFEYVISLPFFFSIFPL